VNVPFPGGPGRARNAAQCDAVLRTPVGVIGIRMAGEAVEEVDFLDPGSVPRGAENPAAGEALRQLRAYFECPRDGFRVPMAPRGTPFQLRVWQALREIPSGSVVTYGELAGRLGSSPRAVGGACRANPCPILVPCHRVVAARGRGGYAGATAGAWMAVKEQLLRLEGASWPR
jgi:methylated-DNA-[protein]-cysteine S-methyltransferase